MPKTIEDLRDAINDFAAAYEARAGSQTKLREVQQALQNAVARRDEVTALVREADAVLREAEKHVAEVGREMVDPGFLENREAVPDPPPPSP